MQGNLKEVPLTSTEEMWGSFANCCPCNGLGCKMLASHLEGPGSTLGLSMQDL
jgi:hypothetical protein